MKLKNTLRGKLTDQELDKLVQSYDVVGTIAILIIPQELEHCEKVIGNAVLDRHPGIKTVAKRMGNYRGEHRTIQLKVIAGENNKETLHKEFGIRFRLNPEQVYFSIRSSTERKRVADQVSAGEIVLVMFSGIGPYPLYIGKFSAAAKIIGIEKNRVAHAFALENLSLNKADDRINLYNGDVREVIPRMGIVFDRIIMPLPKGGSAYLSLALDHLATGGYIHYYVMQQPEMLDQSLLDFSRQCEEASRSVAKHGFYVCGHTAPNTYRYCLDAMIS